ncbi:MAG: hypothetical protein KDD39_01740 [Bdellovibrionales bacterium]|nr:hypothetical protein [Bdellovibrionales bacterium]
MVTRKMLKLLISCALVLSVTSIQAEHDFSEHVEKTEHPNANITVRHWNKEFPQQHSCCVPFGLAFLLGNGDLPTGEDVNCAIERCGKLMDVGVRIEAGIKVQDPFTKGPGDYSKLLERFPELEACPILEEEKNAVLGEFPEYSFKKSLRVPIGVTDGGHWMTITKILRNPKGEVDEITYIDQFGERNLRGSHQAYSSQ